MDNSNANPSTQRGRTIEFPRDFYNRLRVAAALKGMSVKHYAMEVLEKEINEIEVKFNIP